MSKRHSQVMQSSNVSSASIDDMDCNNRSQIQIKYSLPPFKSWERRRESQINDDGRTSMAQTDNAAGANAKSKSSAKHTVRGSVVRP